MIKTIINNPIFRICGVVVILYYGLFKNKYEPESLGNRFSAERIKSNISEVSEKSAYIAENIRKAEKLSAVNSNKSLADENKKPTQDTKKETEQVNIVEVQNNITKEEVKK